MYKEIIQRWKRANPITCHRLGIHEFDGDLPNYSQEAIDNRIRELHDDLQYLSSIDLVTDNYTQFEHNLIKSKLEIELFQLRDLREYQDNPLVYIAPLSLVEASYTSRKFDSIDNRVKYIIKLERKIPKLMQQALQQLHLSLPKPKITLSIQFLQGIINFFTDKLIHFIIKVDEEKLLDEWSQANLNAIQSMKEFKKKLEQVYLPKANENFAIGEEKFLELLQKTEGITVSVEELLKIGFEDLSENLQKLKEVSKIYSDGNILSLISTVKNEYPKPEHLLKEVKNTLIRTKQFLINHDIVSIPTDQQCKVIEMPDFAKSFGFAAMSIPGPFEMEEASEAYYWINIPDPYWTQKRRDKFMQFFNYSFLDVMTIHEVWPGHYLQLLYNKQSKSKIVSLFARSVTLIEGWGHYCEEMMIQQGYAPSDSYKIQTAQLLGALQRNIRYICAIKMHCQGMSVEEAKLLFKDKAFLSEDIANIEAIRGTVNPMYLNYTLGKLLIKKLLQDYSVENAENYRLKDFHDKLLSYGSPPILVLRKLLLTDQSKSIL